MEIGGLKMDICTETLAWVSDTPGMVGGDGMEPRNLSRTTTGQGEREARLQLELPRITSVGTIKRAPPFHYHCGAAVNSNFLVEKKRAQPDMGRPDCEPFFALENLSYRRRCLKQGRAQ
jgi:hypothetical protein